MLSSTWEKIWPLIVSCLPMIWGGIVVFIVFWICGIISQRVIGRLGKSRHIDQHLTSLLGRTAKIGFLVFGAVTALGTFGIDVSALVAGLGLTGFALGFAMKDLISNTIAGILTIVYKPFVYQDYIKLSGFEGVVVDVNLRYTTLEKDSTKVFVPNSMILTNAVVVGKEEAT